MHNRKRLDRAPTEKELEASTLKAGQYTKLVNLLLERRSFKDASDQTLELLSKMLRSNPDILVSQLTLSLS